MDVLIDLETFGIGPDAVICSLGAVRFDPLGEGIKETFYLPVDPQSCIDVGMTVTGGTILWWLRQEEAARHAIAKVMAHYPIKVALEAFWRWYGDAKHVWGKGASFDPVIMTSAFNLTGIPCPWSFRDIRCVRTLEDLAGIGKEAVSVGTVHNALDDATSHALNVQKAYATILNGLAAAMREKDKDALVTVT